MLQLDTNPRELFPKFYDGILEIDELSKAENVLFKDALEELNTLWKNSFIIHCNEEGIAKYEKVLGIVANPAVEDLTLRKNRVLNRFATIPFFTMPWLRARLDDLLGRGNWTYSIDFEKRELVVETVEASSVWLHEVSVTIHQVKPANMIFVSRPFQAFHILANESVSRSIRTDHYRLGTWKLGVKPFAEYSDMEEIKMADTPSIQPELLRQVAAFTRDDIGAVLINNILRIEKKDFISASTEENLVKIEYEVPASEDLETITNVKILDVLGRILVDTTVAIDNTFNVRMNHKIRFEEGVNG